ncbi:MAG: O-antigen ligase family protein, partial [Actinomycetota bacterium]
AEKWLAVAALASMLPSFFVVSGGGRMFTYTRTVGLIGVSLAAMLLARAFAARDEDPRRLVRFLVAFGGALGLWTLAQLVYKGAIHLPLQRTASLLEWLPGRAGDLTSRAVREAAGIKYENIGAGRLVVRPHAFFIHAVVTGAVAGLLGPLVWKRIRPRPIVAAAAAAVASGLLATMLVSSLARGAYLGVAIALPVAVIAFFPQLRRVDWRRAAPSIVIGLGVVAVVALMRGQEAKARNTSQLAEGSFVSRAAYYRATLRKTFEYPLFGHGTQRDNVAAEIVAPKGTTIVSLADGTQEATFANGDRGTITVRKFPSGIQHRIYRDPQGVEIARLISSPDRDPPLGSHSTLLGISYKYGLVGFGAFAALWFFVGLAPLRRLRGESRPYSGESRAIWIGIVAFGAQFLIYEYDFDSTSPYLFYLLCGMLLGLSARPAPVEFGAPSQPVAEPAAAPGTR